MVSSISGFNLVFPRSLTIKYAPEYQLSNFDTLAKFHLHPGSVQILRTVTSLEIHISSKVIREET